MFFNSKLKTWGATEKFLRYGNTAGRPSQSVLIRTGAQHDLEEVRVQLAELTADESSMYEVPNRRRRAEKSLARQRNDNKNATSQINSQQKNTAKFTDEHDHG